MEISDAAMKIINEKKFANVTEPMLSTLMFTSEVVEPDLVIRSSGQKRLSDFLMWQVNVLISYKHRDEFVTLSKDLKVTLPL